jgi:hypothetical protein
MFEMKKKRKKKVIAAVFDDLETISVPDYHCYY